MGLEPRTFGGVLTTSATEAAAINGKYLLTNNFKRARKRQIFAEKVGELSGFFILV